MNCEDYAERLVDRWDGRLSAHERSELDRHLEGCAECRVEASALEGLWQQLGSIESEIVVPSQRLRARFYTFLAEEERRRRSSGLARFGEWLSRLWPREPQAQMALVAAGLVLGVGIGLTSAGLGARSEMTALRGELASVSESVGLSLLSHPAATERLRGVSLTGAAAADDRVVDALIELVASDPNVNVRLAAIEALALRINQPGVKPQLLGTLPAQDSPILQMTLLDVLLPEDGELVLEAAEPLLDDESLDEAVRERLMEVKGSEA